MGILDGLLLVLVGACAVLALSVCRKKRKSGRCCSCGGSCKACHACGKAK